MEISKLPFEISKELSKQLSLTAMSQGLNSHYSSDSPNTPMMQASAATQSVSSKSKTVRSNPQKGRHFYKPELIAWLENQFAENPNTTMTDISAIKIPDGLSAVQIARWMTRKRSTLKKQTSATSSGSSVLNLHTSSLDLPNRATVDSDINHDKHVGGSGNIGKSAVEATKVIDDDTESLTEESYEEHKDNDEKNELLKSDEIEEAHIANDSIDKAINDIKGPPDHIGIPAIDLSFGVKVDSKPISRHIAPNTIQSSPNQIDAKSEAGLNSNRMMDQDEYRLENLELEDSEDMYIMSDVSMERQDSITSADFGIHTINQNTSENLDTQTPSSLTSVIGEGIHKLIDPAQLSRFSRYMSIQQTPQEKLNVIQVLQNTVHEPTLTKFMSGKGIQIINVWLTESIKDSNINEQLVLSILKFIQRLPFDIDCLKHSLLGKSVRKIVKFGTELKLSQEIILIANELMARWTKLIIADRKPVTPKQPQSSRIVVSIAPPNAKYIVKQTPNETRSYQVLKPTTLISNDSAPRLPKIRLKSSSLYHESSTTQSPANPISTHATVVKTTHKPKATASATLTKTVTAKPVGVTEKKNLLVIPPLSGETTKPASNSYFKKLVEPVLTKPKSRSISSPQIAIPNLEIKPICANGDLKRHIDDCNTASFDVASDGLKELGIKDGVIESGQDYHVDKACKLSTSEIGSTGFNLSTEMDTSTLLQPEALRTDSLNMTLPDVLPSYKREVVQSSGDQPVSPEMRRLDKNNIISILAKPIYGEIAAAAALNSAVSTRFGKPKKSVRFRPDDQLCKIKYIEKAVYEKSGSGDRTKARDFDKFEGQQAFQQLRDEQQPVIDWQAPRELLLRNQVQRGSNSTEAKVQEERERTALSKVYYLDSDIPPSPAEPNVVYSTTLETDYDAFATSIPLTKLGANAIVAPIASVAPTWAIPTAITPVINPTITTPNYLDAVLARVSQTAVKDTWSPPISSLDTTGLSISTLNSLSELASTLLTPSGGLAAALLSTLATASAVSVPQATTEYTYLTKNNPNEDTSKLKTGLNGAPVSYPYTGQANQSANGTSNFASTTASNLFGHNNYTPTAPVSNYYDHNESYDLKRRHDFNSHAPPYHTSRGNEYDYNSDRFNGGADSYTFGNGENTYRRDTPYHGGQDLGEYGHAKKPRYNSGGKYDVRPICEFYKRGQCKYGNHCRKRHE
ncbi:hypothetical protein QVD99_002426 [Batrachochytrium dendrobatidis]|nr:hypothetical protein O5D80_006654 [Batrachochytrium dendrobatidis]KAK5670647.1 hypothetical protein QVD99_002426 [Batrachochytrium dendrobatidis]